MRSHAQGVAVPAVPAVTPLVWVTITQESASIAVTMPTGLTARIGTPSCAATGGAAAWSEQVTLPYPVTLDPMSMAGAAAAQFPFPDPCLGTVKELDVLEVANPQTVIVSDLTLSPLAPVERIVPGLAPVTSLALLPGSAHTLTFTNFTNDATTPNSLLFAFVNQPASNADRTWEGTQMELDIDGVALTCGYGQTYTDAVYTLSCSVPGAP